jgi:hypothetical protein
MPINIRIPPEIDESDDTESASLVLDREYLWPANGDRLFRTAYNWEKSVNFSNHRISRHIDIWNGYMRSGDILVEECSRNPTDGYDFIYPILYCYRHGLELAMKWVVDMYGRLVGVYSADYLDHDLRKLWAVCKKVLLEVGSYDDSEALRAVQQIVNEFHEWDKLSMAFRYSCDKHGFTLKLPDYPIDLNNIKNVMQAVGHFFLAADAQLDATSSNTGYEY